MPIDPNDFRSTLPYDAQYVGSFQPLLGWVGRTAGEKLMGDLGKAVSGVVATVARDHRRAAAIAPGTSPAMLPQALFSPWLRGVQRFLDRGGNGTRHGGSLMDRLFRRNSEAARPTTGGAGAAGARNGGAVAASLATESSLNTAHQFLVDSNAFQQLVAAGATLNADAYRHLVSWLEEFDFSTVPDARLLLSPIGVLHLYREYYYDFGTFLGPALEHLWIAPRSEVEMRELYSRTDYRFRELETTLDQRESTEKSLVESDEFSEQLTRENETDLSAGVSAEGGADFEVWHVGGSASFNLANSRRDSKQEVRKITRQKSSKVAREMRRTVRQLAREAVEIRQESTRLHRIANPSDQLINFELRRKMQNVGVQVQHLGSQLCWQVYVDRAGDELGLAELVHIARPDDFETTPPPDSAPPALERMTETYVFRIPFTPVRTNANSDVNSDTNNTYYRSAANPQLATDDPSESPDQSDDVIQAVFVRRATPPVPGYELVDVRETNRRGTAADHDQPSEWSVTYDVLPPRQGVDGEFTVTLETVNFEQQPDVEVTVECVWGPSAALVQAKTNEHNGQIGQYNAQMQQRAREALVAGLRERVELARRVSPRPAEDLRAEERSLIYRQLLRRLLGSAAGSELHLLSERVRAIFDVDKMLYFVAPDWWHPRETAAGTLPDQRELAQTDRVRFGGPQADRENNYLVTENSAPAVLGSSLGWLLQLDGDDRRNAYLNAPWIKAVLPIRPGRERAAIEWLRQPHVEGTQGLDAEHVDPDGRPTGETVGERLLRLARELQVQDDEPYQAGQRVYETGFVPIDGTVRITGQPYEVFAQWIEVVPTRQIVPVPYPGR